MIFHLLNQGLYLNSQNSLKSEKIYLFIFFSLQVNYIQPFMSLAEYV